MISRGDREDSAEIRNQREQERRLQQIKTEPGRLEVKFNGKINFSMLRCEVMDALTASNLEDTLRLEKKHNSTTEEDWDKMNRTACGLIRSCLTHDIKYQM